MNIPKIDLNLGKSLEENIIIEDDSTNIPKIDLNLGKPLEEQEINKDDINKSAINIFFIFVTSF